MSIGIYKIENLLSHKIYIGQSINIEKRWKEHCQPSSNSLIAKDIQKYGKDNFSFIILEECLIDKLNEREDFYIRQYRSLVPNGYNVVENNAGRHTLYIKYSKEVLLNIISDIKSTNLSFKEIGQKYNLDCSMIYYLNRGDYHHNEKETYPLRPVKDASKKHQFCKRCGKEIYLYAQYCSECIHIQQRIVERPPREELKFLIKKYSFSEIGRKYNVSDNAIRKWCKNENLPYRKKDINQYTDQEWKQL